MDKKEKEDITREISEQIAKEYSEAFRQMNGSIVECLVRVNTVENLLIKHNIVSREEYNQLVAANIQVFGKEIEKILAKNKNNSN